MQRPHWDHMRIALAALALLLSGPVTGPAQLVATGNGKARLVALTFDAGADRGYAAQILTTLEHRGIRASFGMTGLWAQQNPDLVRRMVKDHDILINHTFDHRSFTGLSTKSAPLSGAQRRWEINEAAAVIRKITGLTPRPYFRPPFGDYDAATQALAGQLGYRYMIMWSVDSLGWERLPAPAIIQRCLVLVHPGGIILMHVGSLSQDAVALPAVITGLAREGYRFVTVAQLLAAA